MYFVGRIAVSVKCDLLLSLVWFQCAVLEPKRLIEMSNIVHVPNRFAKLVLVYVVLKKRKYALVCKYF